MCSGDKRISLNNSWDDEVAEGLPQLIYQLNEIKSSRGGAPRGSVPSCCAEGDGPALEQESVWLTPTTETAEVMHPPVTLTQEEELSSLSENTTLINKPAWASTYVKMLFN